MLSVRGIARARHSILMAAIGVAATVTLLAAVPGQAVAQSLFAGVYTGTFSGSRDNGAFAILVRGDNVATFMAFDTFDALGFVNRNVTINPGGSFAKSNIDGMGTFVSGTLTTTTVSGSFVDGDGFTANLQGTKQPGNGFARDVGGFYAGGIFGTVTFDGSQVGTFSGDWYMLIAANGQLFQVIEASVSALGQTERIEEGGPSAVSSVGELCQSVSLPSVSFTCTFDPNTFTFSGTFFVSDLGITISGTFSLTRQEPLPNQVPVAAADAYEVLARRTLVVDAAAGVLANDSDGDGDPLTAAVAANLANGTLALTADGGFTYTPDADFDGVDSFTYRASDGLANSNLATVTITVEAVKAMPWLLLLLD